MIFTDLATGRTTEQLVSLSQRPQASANWVAAAIESGESRPEWCRMAWSDSRQLLAAHIFDSWSPDRPPGPVPSFVQLLGHRDAEAAAELLRHDLTALDAQSVIAHIVVADDAPPALRALRQSQPAVLVAAGFELEVERVRLTWPEGAESPRPAGTLSFRPAADLETGVLTELFAQVADGSGDYGMRTGQTELGRQQEAAQRLHRAQRRQYPPSWFVVGEDPDGAQVGYVQTATMSGRAILAEIGVAQAHRGHRYVDELLAYGTSIALGAGHASLAADTDRDNHAMRAAFARGGYLEFATRSDFRWTKPS